MSNKVIKAIDAALKMLQLNKLCFAAEDDDSYYFTGCSDYGERICGEACCRVSKETLECTHCYHDDPRWNTPKVPIEIPKERSNVYIPYEETTP